MRRRAWILALAPITMGLDCKPEELPDNLWLECLDYSTQAPPAAEHYTWPDDRPDAGTSLSDFANELPDGALLFLRAGVYEEVAIMPVDRSEPWNVDTRLKVLHLFGESPETTKLLGTLRLGAGSSIHDLAIDNRSAYPEHTTVEVNPPGLGLYNSQILGGRNNLLVGTDTLLGSTSAEPGATLLDCVLMANPTYNGAVFGDELGWTVDDLQLADVAIYNTGNMGLELLGDRASINGLSVANAGTGGIQVQGAEASLSGVSIHTTGKVGVAVNGDGAALDAVSVDDAGTWGISVEGASGQVLSSSVRRSGSLGLSLASENGVVDGASVSSSGGSGVVLSGTGAVLRNASISQAHNAGIWIEATGVSVEDSTVSDTLATGEDFDNAKGIYVTEGSTGFSLARVSVDGAYWGLYTFVDPYTEGTLTEVVFSGIRGQDILYVEDGGW